MAISSTIQNDTAMYSGRRMKEAWLFINAAGDSTDKITAKRLTRIDWVEGQKISGHTGNAPYTIDNTVFPPTATLNDLSSGDDGVVILVGS